MYTYSIALSTYQPYKKNIKNTKKIKFGKVSIIQRNVVKINSKLHKTFSNLDTLPLKGEGHTM